MTYPKEPSGQGGWPEADGQGWPSAAPGAAQTDAWPTASVPARTAEPFAGVPPQQDGTRPRPWPEPRPLPEPQRLPEPAVRPEPPVQSEPPAQARPKKPGRDRYLDLLRSLALVRVVVYHLFGWAWLTIVFPSMGVMFALAGSLMARSLKRPALSVIRGRVRRLLPPLWAFSAVALALLFVGGWNPGSDPDTGGGTWGWLDLVDYVFPFAAPSFPWEIANPPGFLESTWAEQAIGPLWYLRAYLWFVFASPLLLWAFRKVPWATLCAPLALTAVVGTGLVTIPGRTGEAVTDFAVYGSCWVLGFAHQEGTLAKVPRYAAVSGAALLMAFGLWWASGHLTEEGWNLDEIPLAQAAWSLGFVAILLQYAPSWQQLPGRLARWDRLVTLANNRAVTIYLWHNILIMATFPLIDRLYELPFMDDRLSSALDSTYMLWSLVLVWPLIALAILGTGWIEDLAAKRSPRLWPDGGGKASGSRSGGTSRKKGRGRAR
ncbi:acyltransferase family protein [Streptomyces sp. SID8379]|uniref:acyltransferase family protein n=1 Tax=unclassified Streptomyces TaxID=2593676 RepID=UPI00036A2416|nr:MULTISPECIES: acyltransferase [unclassified Streptomyces]MYW64751.1 acyltransferase family protein [Streptomyces sp. SID8379]